MAETTAVSDLSILEPSEIETTFKFDSIVSFSSFEKPPSGPMRIAAGLFIYP